MGKIKLVLDGNNTAYRARSTVTLKTKQGEDVSAIFGTLRILESYLKPTRGGWKNKILDAVQDARLNRTIGFDEVITCWDGGKSQFRKSFYPEYKAHREKKRKEYTPEEQASYYAFLDQMEEMHEVLNMFGVRSLKVKGWEADDLMCSVAKLKAPDDVVILVSTDRDMLQLVDENVYVWSPIKEVLVTPKNFAEFTGLTKDTYLTFRALVGDSSDNIIGIEGIGDKKGKDLMYKYKSLEGIKENQAVLSKSKVFIRIFENDMAIVNRNLKLMDLNKVPFEEIQDYVVGELGKSVRFETEFVRTFFMSKQFISILKDFATWSLPFQNLK